MTKLYYYCLFIVLLAYANVATAAPIDIGSRLEPIVDDYLIERLDGAEMRLHHPVPREVVLTFDKPWEGPFSGYITVLKDKDRYRMYYRGLPIITKKPLGREVTCYAESADGVRWTKPELRLHEVDGTKNNNVILVNHTACHNFAPMLD
ncbi:MAG: hypothetical protein JW959_07230, partial [Pirellulales bacterium]|nr:hypothetical protein [Pirellulales bacterium]